MNSDWPEDPEKYSRLDADLTEKDPVDSDESNEGTEEHRDFFKVTDEVTPSPDRQMAVYGDTDINPNEDDQRDVHEGDSDERI